MRRHLHSSNCSDGCDKKPMEHHHFDLEEWIYMSAYTDLENFLEKNESVEAIMFENWNQIEDEEAVQEAIKETRRKNIVEDLLRYPSFLVSDFEDLLASNRATVKLFLSTLVQNRALRRKRGWYEKAPAFIQLLRRMRQKASS